MAQDLNDKKNISGAQFTQPPDEFKVNSPTSIVGFDFCDVRPWCPQYIDLQDRLFVTVVATTAAQFVNVVVRMLRPDGTIVLLPFIAPGGAVGVANSTAFPLMEGFILSVSVNGSGAGVAQYPIFASVALVRQQATAALQSCTLCAGYVNNSTGFGYPQHQPQRMTDGAGWIQSSKLAQQGAGQDNTFTVPVGQRWRILSFTAALTTAVAVANRFVSLLLDDGANVYALIPGGTVQVASLTYTYTFADSTQNAANINNVFTAPLPSNLIMPAGHRIRTATAGLQGADQWGQVWALVQIWLDAV
jgi:hypothetical protein